MGPTFLKIILSFILSFSLSRLQKKSTLAYSRVIYVHKRQLREKRLPVSIFLGSIEQTTIDFLCILHIFLRRGWVYARLRFFSKCCVCRNGFDFQHTVDLLAECPSCHPAHSVVFYVASRSSSLLLTRSIILGWSLHACCILLSDTTETKDRAVVCRLSQGTG